MRALYPEIAPFHQDSIQTDPGHTVYFEQVGNPDGLPVIFLHGGPGSGCDENHRRYFNPDKYRIVLFDQRGCHRSTPNGQIEANTTQLILNDIECIRKKLGIEKWLLFGGSWGATLALLYAESFPGRVLGMTLRGSFLARQRDLDWFIKSGVNRIFPDFWHEFMSSFSASEQTNLIPSLHARVFSEKRETALETAKVWALWAGRVVTHSLLTDYVLDTSDEAKLMNEVRIEVHYALNRYFIEENQILKHISKVPAVPVTIIHGRQDLTCLPEVSWLLHRALPRSKLIMVPNAGHLTGEETMIDALVTATDEMAEKSW